MPGPVRRATTDAPTGARPKAKARVTALRLLAQRRLTESQLWSRLARRGYDGDEIRAAVDSCKADGFVDDALYAQLFVDGRLKAVGNARLVAELVQRGIERDAAKQSVERAERAEDDRLASAVQKLFRTRESLGYSGAARALERLGFPAHAIYRHLRARAASEL
ncbi:MAG: regulatory protein RecX [Candidatus Eremiobacteraeota bacterium]|nr:regulatory protein RecX [Candidatus Eremiobacteraeota bacterium]